MAQKSITKKEAVEISRKIMEIAEKERIFMAELEAQKGLQYKDGPFGHEWRETWCILVVLLMVVAGLAISGWMARHFVAW